MPGERAGILAFSASLVISGRFKRRPLRHIAGRIAVRRGWLVASACLALAGAGAARRSRPRGSSRHRLAKVGITDMSKTQQADLWKLVDEYATVDALQEFCGTKLNLQRRAWRAVGTCVEPTSLRKVIGTFKTKKDGYLKQWETLHGQPDAKKAVCERFKTKLAEYSKIMSGQINEAATRVPQLLLLLRRLVAQSPIAVAAIHQSGGVRAAARPPSRRRCASAKIP